METRNRATEGSGEVQSQGPDRRGPAVVARHLAHVVAPTDLRQGLASVPPGLGLWDLMGRQLWPPAETHSPGHHPGATLASTAKIKERSNSASPAETITINGEFDIPAAGPPCRPLRIRRRRPAGRLHPCDRKSGRSKTTVAQLPHNLNSVGAAVRRLAPAQQPSTKKSYPASGALA